MTRTAPIRALLLGCLLALVAGAGASAGTLTNEGGTWVYRAAPGERNVFHIRPDDQSRNGIYFHDEAIAIADASGTCHREDWDDETDLRCAYGGGVRVELGDNDDWLFVGDDLPGGQVVVGDGGPGNDRLSGPLRGVGVTFLGGDGNDHLDGGHLADVLDGGPGADTIEGDPGNDVVRGGEGNDNVAGDEGADVVDGGAGWDTMDRDYVNLDNPGAVTLTLDGVADDGFPGEGDNVVAVEDFSVTHPGVFRAGGDAVRVRFDNHWAAGSSVVGSPGDDSIRTYDYNDTIDGGAGNDTIEGGYGDDTITGGPGRDTINAEAGTGSCNFLVCRVGGGNDTIHVRDGEQDSVTCGVGTDTVIADPIDTIAADCEHVDKGVIAPPPAQRRNEPGARSGGRGAKRCVVPKIKAGTKLAAAKRALARSGCKVKVKRRASRKIRKGRAIKLSARAGKKLAPKTTITIFVSKGR